MPHSDHHAAPTTHSRSSPQQARQHHDLLPIRSSTLLIARPRSSLSSASSTPGSDSLPRRGCGQVPGRNLAAMPRPLLKSPSEVPSVSTTRFHRSPSHEIPPLAKLTAAHMAIRPLRRVDTGTVLPNRSCTNSSACEPSTTSISPIPSRVVQIGRIPPVPSRAHAPHPHGLSY
jgi:hypothetical protein